ncbi:pirin family protein [Parabacteroides sp. PF5-9]|uniref:pirin family protein n=1 Tax=Parabacteroides sp. PF5-9 TaxID=1742404 RepID=UPI0024730304|nr:pirin family protein [Parabacteroides sp. PF5-9]MDH6359088.1 redox-sensitive bicupin YhaK (pirin superfamily) [Parabacteroides sp. PF5-9]
MKRKVVETVKGLPAIDGAGVHLVRVLGNNTVYKFDPFLMLDAFDSNNPADYIKGFPMHPHRGIETFTYLMKGRIDHEDSLGHKGTIHSGESQWMTGGSGILHQEMPQPVDHLLGLQLWINLPRNEKMTAPKYFEITADMIKTVEEENASVSIVAGKYKGHQGAKGHHIDTTVLDITVKPDGEFTISTDPEATLFIYIVDGKGQFDGSLLPIPRKTAVLFSKDDEFYVKAGAEGIHFILFTARPLGEPIVWGGPIVMNTREELMEAFTELSEGTFIKN